jgi:putative photosynthetic complex assembly protein 2
MTMESLWLAALFAVFIWWFSTGIILLLDNLPRTTFGLSRLVSSSLALAALWALAATAHSTSLAAVYCAFTSALLVWGWHELSFLTGWVTGPQRTAIAPDVQGWPRFKAAVRAILWHELAIAVTGVLILVLTWNAPNPIGAYTFLVLWVMRISAKLNLFLGVRNLSEEFLPPHLTYMASFFRRRRMNALLPLAIAAATVVAMLLVQQALAPATSPAMAVGLTLVAVMLGLAIVEHALLVLPLPATALWRWAMRRQAPGAPGSAVGPADHAAAPIVDRRAANPGERYIERRIDRSAERSATSPPAPTRPRPC